MSARQPFAPAYGNGTGPLTGSGTSQKTAAVFSKGAKNLRVLVTGTGVGYIRTFNNASFDTGADTATTKDYPVAGGLTTTITKPEGHDSIAYIGAGLVFYPIIGEGW